MCLAQGPQRSDAGEARTHGPSVLSQALYHWATALPSRINVFCSRTTTQWRRWGSNPRPLGLLSSTLPLSHCAPYVDRDEKAVWCCISPGWALFAKIKTTFRDRKYKKEKSHTYWENPSEYKVNHMLYNRCVSYENNIGQQMNGEFALRAIIFLTDFEFI